MYPERRQCDGKFMRAPTVFLGDTGSCMTKYQAANTKKGSSSLSVGRSLFVYMSWSSPRGHKSRRSFLLEQDGKDSMNRKQAYLNFLI